MGAAVPAAIARLRAAPRRALGAAAGILLAATMAGAAVTVAYGLSTGFDRAAREADLPDVLVRFDAEPREHVERLMRALPNVAAIATRTEITGVDLRVPGGGSPRGVVQAVDGPRRGYAIVEGRDLVDGRPDEVVVERGVAREWHVGPGDRLAVGRLRPLRVAGVAVAPDNVAYPLASAPRVYLSRRWIERDLARAPIGTNQALVWAADPDGVDVLLQQARATSFGLRDVRFLTRDGVRILIDEAAGIVVALLIAFSLIALGAAALILGAGARADVERRLHTIGVQRAIGVSRAAVAVEHALAAGVVAAVAGAAGLAAGAVAVGRPSTRLIEALNEQPPGASLLAPLMGALAVIVAMVTAATAWPAWRAGGRPPVALLRGAELSHARRGRRRGGGGPLVLGARLALARRVRVAGTAVVLAACTSVVLLLLGLASLVDDLRDDPGSIGKRYDLTARLPASESGAVRSIHGVAAAAPRYVVRGADSFQLQESVKLVAFAAPDHTVFEDPPLASGRRLRRQDEAEVGLGLGQALGLGLGGTLAVQLPSGAEARFRVVGLVRALDDDGRLAYVRPERVLAASPGLGSEIAVRLEPGADARGVRRDLAALGARSSSVGGATTRSAGFLEVLAGLLRAVAGLDALVCLAALVQALALTARERRPTLSVLRACGAGTRTIAAVLAGAGFVVAVPAAAAAVALEQWLLAPLTGGLAAGYADLQPATGAATATTVAAALIVLALLAAGWVARCVVTEPPVAGLREE